MKYLARILGASCLAAAAIATVPAARAGVDVSFGMHAPVGNDGDLFFSISSRYFDRSPQVVMDWSRRIPNPDDLAVFLHICSHTRMTPDRVFAFRQQGLPWYDVGVRVGVPVDAWYVPVERDPGPPYGNAYGYWRKHQRDPHYTVRLSDHECRDLVSMRMAHEYYGVSPEVAMNWRRNGDVRTVMTREYRSRHDEHERRGNGDNDDQGDKHHGNHGDHGDHGHHGNHGNHGN